LTRSLNARSSRARNRSMKRASIESSLIRPSTRRYTAASGHAHGRGHQSKGASSRAQAPTPSHMARYRAGGLRVRRREASFVFPGSEHHARSEVTRLAFAGRRVVLLENLGFEGDDAIVGVSGAAGVVEDPGLERSPVGIAVGNAVGEVAPEFVLLHVL